jgi:hypothetical protein
MVAAAVMCGTMSAPSSLATLVAEYNFSGNANDSSGNALHGTNNGAVLTADRFANASSAYDFNGSARIEVPHDPLLNPTTGEWSMSAWIKSTQGDYILGMGWDGTATEGFSYGLFAGPPYVSATAWCCAGGTHMRAFSAAAGAVAMDGSWHHIVGTIKNNDSLKVYLDGILVATDDATDAAGPWNVNINQPFWIGEVQNASSAPFVGIIDDVKLFNHVLSDDEVLALFQVPEPSALAFVLVAWSTIGIVGPRTRMLRAR